MAIRLNEILAYFEIESNDDRMIQGISDHSKEIQKDHIFICRRYCEKYIEEALNKGGIVFLEESINKKDCFIIQNLSLYYVKLIKFIYGDVMKDMHVIAVCGTNGKTSISYMIQNGSKYDYMRISTHEICYLDQVIPTRHTTPDIFQLAYYFNLAKKNGIHHIVMEVSSHAIDMHRIAFIQFDLIIYSSFQKDHLDYHHCVTHYHYTKLKLRFYLKKDGKIIVLEDFPYISFLKRYGYHNIEVVKLDHDHVKYYVDHTNFLMYGKWMKMNFVAPFQYENAMLAIHCLLYLKEDMESIAKRFEEMKTVSGRCEVISAKGKTIYIDYAHTPDALYRLLNFAKTLDHHEVYVVIGCGGNRDRTKRSKIAQVAIEYSDHAIFTSDNPRNETTHQILYDMIENCDYNYDIFENREFAIKYTIKKSIEDDIIIIAGKGNEETQEISGIFYSFLDKDCVLKYLNKEEHEWK